MGHRTTGESLRKSLSLACLALSVSLFLPALTAGPAAAADLTLASKTYGLFYQREYPGRTESYAPLYEYLSLDAANLAGKPYSMHFYGWGRVDLGDDSGSGSTSGEIGSFYLEYQHPEGNAQAKLGRFFLTEGAAMMILDGAFVKATSPVGLGLSLYGGVPVEYTILDNGVKGGSSVYGGRVFYVTPGVFEIGATYLKENGNFLEGKDLELWGGDLWLRVWKPVELTGQYTYNQEMSETASQRYAVRVVPSPTFDITVGYEQYTYKGLFQAALNPAFLPPSANINDKVKAFFGVFNWEFVPQWTLVVADKELDHDLSNPGNANRLEVGVRYAYNDRKDTAGLSAAFVSADQAVNEYQEYRGFATYSPGKIRLTLDALTQRYEQEIAGEKSQTQVVATAGYQLLASLQLSGNLTYTESPSFQEDWAGLIRVNYDFGTSTGGKK
jgi:hypothetical protein